MAQWKWIWLVSWGWGFEPWLCSVGRGSGIAVSYSVDRWCGSDPALLWLWHRLAAVRLIRSSLGTFICRGCSPKKWKKKKKLHSLTYIRYAMPILLKTFLIFFSKLKCPISIPYIKTLSYKTHLNRHSSYKVFLEAYCQHFSKSSILYNLNTVTINNYRVHLLSWFSKELFTPISSSQLDHK